MHIDYPTEYQIPALKTLWKKAFGDEDALIDCFFDTGFSLARCQVLTEADRPAAALYWFDCFVASEKWAYLYAVATDPAFRGRGFCRSLMASTHNLLQAQGYAGAVLVPAEKGLSKMYAAMGYRFFSGMEEFSCAAADTETAIRKISPAEYAVLRRNYLPPGSVIQEETLLNFLSATARFFAGEDFLLAAETEPNFRGLELLGNTAKAPEILQALGYPFGTFRISGKASFAMARSFSAASFPSYFGLALD